MPEWKDGGICDFVGGNSQAKGGKFKYAVYKCDCEQPECRTYVVEGLFIDPKDPTMMCREIVSMGPDQWKLAIAALLREFIVHKEYDA